MCVRIFSGGWGMAPLLAFTLYPKILRSRIKNKKLIQRKKVGY